jgi:hypothetical protein
MGEAPAGATEQRPHYLHSRPPFQGLFGWHSLFPGLRAALRRFIPGYCSLSTSGADDGWTLSPDGIAQKQPNSSDASGAEKEKGKWHDEAGMTEIRGSSSLGACATGRRSLRTETSNLPDGG